MAVVCVCALALVASAMLPAGFVGRPRADAATTLDAAAARAVALQQRLEDLTDEQTAIQLRVDDTAGRLRAQTKVVGRAREDAAQAQQRLHTRAVAMYKTTDMDTMALFLTSDSWGDLVTRADLVRRLLSEDARELGEARRVTAEAEHEAQVLAGIRKEDLALRNLQRQRVGSVRAALAEQTRLVATLTAEARRQLEARKAAAAAAKRKWAASSVSNASTIRVGPVTVNPYTDRTFLAPTYFPRVFSTTGKQFTGLASWMGAGIDGHNTASGRRFNHNDYTCAHRYLPFGTYLALTRNGKRVVVVVTDRGPYTGGRVLDLSQASAKALGIDGVSTVKAEVVVKAQ